ncbi:MAG: DivIVA domain-containing protein [Clostridiales bacterium]|nr:DivIVA domain-containing protein [Clostridiales bacterium]
MAITVTMIEEKEFKTKVRGYDPLEVDEFLDAICDEMESMNQTIQQLREQLKQQQQAPTPFMPAVAAPAPLAPVSAPAAPPALPSDLKTAQQLLEKTQKACDEVIAKARERAEEIIQTAEDSLPDPELDDLEARKEALKKEIEVLEADAQKFKQRFQTMLKDQIDILDSELN